MYYNYIVSSALLLWSALTMPALCCLAVFLYLIPIFYCAMCDKKRLTFRDGFLWGLVLYGLHWYDVAILSYVHGYGIARYFVMPVLVVYVALYAGTWFWIGPWVANYTRKEAFSWITITWVYIIFMQRASFWILGRMQGYPFSFPLIPLGEYSRVLGILQYMHPHVLLLLIIAASWIFACAWHTKKAYAAYSAMLCYMPIALGLLLHTEATPPKRSTTVGYISPQSLSDDFLERAGELAQRSNHLVKTHPEITHIVTPESMFPISLNNHPEILDCLTKNSDHSGIITILGTERKDEDKCHRCCLFVQSGLIIQGYDKKLLMPFAEYIPHDWLNFDVFKRIFLHNKKIMNLSSKKGDFISDFTPMICSDYYLDWYDEPQEGRAPLLLLVNETWFNGKYLRRLMKLAARYGALARRQDVVYVGHGEGWYFSQDGRSWPLLGA